MCSVRYLIGPKIYLCSCILRTIPVKEVVGSFHNGSFSRIDLSRKIPKLHLISWCRNVGNAEYLQRFHTRKLGEFSVFYVVIRVRVFKYHYCDDWNAYAFLVVKKKTGLKINFKKKKIMEISY